MLVSVLDGGDMTILSLIKHDDIMPGRQVAIFTVKWERDSESTLVIILRIYSSARYYTKSLKYSNLCNPCSRGTVTTLA